MELLHVMINWIEYRPVPVVKDRAERAEPMWHVHMGSEGALIAAARKSISDTSWMVGLCAHEWIRSFAKGRGHVQFAEMTGLSVDQIRQRRLVWEEFGDVKDKYPHLQWSHFYAALHWPDASVNLAWANDVKAGVAEMRAWRRAQNGEDLIQDDLKEES